MKSLIFFCLLGLSFYTYSTPVDYLYCLGQEEKSIHQKKIGGAKKYLVEKIISETLLFGEQVQLNKRYLKEVCESSSPGLSILKLLLKQKSVFIPKASSYDGQALALAKVKIKALHEQSLHIFIGFLGWIKNQNSDVNCFKKHLPELHQLYNKVLFTLEERGEKTLLKELKNIDLIFKKIEIYPYGKKKC